MASEAGSFLPDEDELLSRLWLNATDAARVCGVTVRQLTYWTDRGIIRSHNGDGRTYDLAALRKTVAIKRIMLEGYTLEKAAQLVESAERAEEPDLGLGYIDRLLAEVRVCAPRMPALLALGRLRRVAAAAAGLDLERCLAEDDGTGDTARQIASLLNNSAAALEQSMAAVTHAPERQPVSLSVESTESAAVETA
ncbi:MAG: MerR family transcriptional regulator [Chloroflexi bacterium]|nr:MerR family transcriptional regulator [Chloroflexota bacterium]